MSSVMNPRTRSGKLRHGARIRTKWIALFAIMIANMIVCSAHAQAPLPGAVQQGPVGSPPGAQAPLPGAVQQGPVGSPPGAQAPLSGAVQQGPVGSPPGFEQIMTAIDVSDMLRRGDGNAEIAKLLSNQKGFDRVSALKKGQTDEQIIRYLITKTGTLRPVAGANMSKQHENEGDKQYRESRYGKAAKEYTLAIEYSGQNPAPYKLRADTYKQYLKTNLIPAAIAGPNTAKKALFDQSKALLCHAIQFDYTQAYDLNQKALAAINADTYLLSNKMNQDITNYEQDSKVTPYHIKSAERTHDQRRLRNLYQSQRAAIQAGNSIKAAMKDYEAVCQTKPNPSR